MRPPPLRQAFIFIDATSQPSDSVASGNHAAIDSCYHLSAVTEKDMKFIRLIANAFINTMGITQPSPQAANRAAWFIFIMLIAVIAAVATIAVVAINLASQH
jgi:hypothetical protein